MRPSHLGGMRIAAAALAAIAALGIAPASGREEEDGAFRIVTDFATGKAEMRNCDGRIERGFASETASDLREKRSRYVSCGRLRGRGPIPLKLRGGLLVACDAAKPISTYLDGRVFECVLATPVTIDFGAGPAQCIGKFWIYGDGHPQACDSEPPRR